MCGKPSGNRGGQSDGTNVFEPLGTNGRILVVVALVSLATSVIVATLHFEGHVSVYRLISDPAPFVGMPWYFGSLSHAGVLLWTVSAAICVFASRLLWDSVDKGRRRLSRLLAILGGGSTWLALDDLLMIHEQLGRLMFGQESRHYGEALVFGAYAMFLLGCFVWYRDIVAQTEVVLLFGALISLTVSVAIDTVLQLDIGGNNYVLEIVLSRSWGGPAIDIVEDVLKLNGGMLMLAYFFRTGFNAVQREMSPASLVGAEILEVSPDLKRRQKLARR